MSLKVVKGRLRILKIIVGLCLCPPPMAFAGQESTSTKNSEESQSTRSNLNEWKKIVLREKDVTSKVKFAESLASGLSIFAIGLYGSETDKDQSITSGIYSFLQTGGIIVASKGIQTYLEGSVVLDMRKFYGENDKMNKRQMHQIWADHAARAEYAANVADLFLWSSLSAVYLRAGFSQPKKSATSRSIYFFLSGNSFILGSVALYKVINREPITRDDSKWSVEASPSGVALEWKAEF